MPITHESTAPTQDSGAASLTGRRFAEAARHIRLMAFDLDGTLLNSDKELTPRTRAALTAAAERGVEIVPASGRIFIGMPEAVRALPFLRYAIAVNGGQLIDAATGEALYSADVPTEDAVALYAYLDTLPVIYDCYIDGWGYMTASMQAEAERYVANVHILKMVRELRTPVPELKAFLIEGARRPHKLQLFTRDAALRGELLRTLPERFPNFAVSSSLPFNIEFNSTDAQKGLAMLDLARRLGLDAAQTAAFGDGLNDLSMLRAAGIGVAMANGHPDVRAAADVVAEDCDSDGVAKVVEAILAASDGDDL